MQNTKADATTPGREIIKAFWMCSIGRQLPKCAPEKKTRGHRTDYDCILFPVVFPI